LHQEHDFVGDVEPDAMHAVTNVVKRTCGKTKWCSKH